MIVTILNKRMGDLNQLKYGPLYLNAKVNEIIDVARLKMRACPAWSHWLKTSSLTPTKSMGNPHEQGHLIL